MTFICDIILPSLVIAQWSAPINLSPNAISAGLNESMGSCIGVSGDTVHVVWSDRFSATKGAIYYTRSIDTGLTWSTPIAISSINGNAWNAAIAVNGSNIHVAWREIDTVNNHRSSWYNHSSDGGTTWGTSAAIDTGIADWPAITVSGNNVYVANDIIVDSTGNTEIFFLKSTDNGNTWSPHQRLTYAVNRSEDEAIIAEGAHVFMAWNDKRTDSMKIFYKHSADYGVTWDSDVALSLPYGYGTMVYADGANIEVPYAGAPSGLYQIHLIQSADTGVTWGVNLNLTNDAANTYYYPDMVRDGNDLHLTYVKAGVGGQYLHSGDGGTTWDAPYNLGNSGITPFVAYTGCVVHIIVPDSGHINYLRNPIGNGGAHCITTTGISSSAIGEGLEVTVSPNPFDSQTTLEISSSESHEDLSLKIFDSLGREIMNAPFGNNNKIILSKDKLNSGIYFYTVFQKEKVFATGKMMVK